MIGYLQQEERVNEEQEERVNEKQEERVNEEQEERVNEEQEERVDEEQEERVNEEQEERVNEKQEERVDEEQEERVNEKQESFWKRLFGKIYYPPLELETKSVFTPKNPLIKKMKILNFQKILNPQKKNSPNRKKSITFEKLSNRTLQYQHFFSLATISTPPLQKILEKQKAQPDQKLKSCYSSPKSSSKFGSVADCSGSSSKKVESCGFFWSNFESESSKS